MKVAQSCPFFCDPTIWPSRFVCPFSSPGKNTGVGRRSLLQGIFPTQKSNRGLLRCRQFLYQLSYQESDTVLGESIMKTIPQIIVLKPQSISLQYITSGSPSSMPNCPSLKQLQRTSLVIQWLRLSGSNVGGLGSIPDKGTKIPHATTKDSTCHN